MQPLQGNQASKALLRSGMVAPCTTASNPPAQWKLEICQYKANLLPNYFKLKHFPFILNGKLYHRIHQQTGCDSVSKNDEILLESFTDRQEEKSSLIKKRLSDVITKGFNNVCTGFDEYTKKTIYGVCHDFAHYLSLGFSNCESRKYKDYDAFYESLPYIKVTEFTGEQDLRFGDIVEITEQPACVEHKPPVYHSMVYIGDGKYISKISGLDIYIHDRESILDMVEDWKKGNLRVIREADTR
ncbi:hypothetical protein [Endozoicomonas sp. 4G]|uniref:hypothetical protein n=1 Tax=Endozoicomonas sp. 4G TaxID=2872754 RepID=UPI002078A27F|nr:hypothetical protein [Endozoicomonas sp. 4G]